MPHLRRTTIKKGLQMRRLNIRSLTACALIATGLTIATGTAGASTQLTTCAVTVTGTNPTTVGVTLTDGYDLLDNGVGFSVSCSNVNTTYSSMLIPFKLDGGYGEITVFASASPSPTATSTVATCPNVSGNSGDELPSSFTLSATPSYGAVDCTAGVSTSTVMNWWSPTSTATMNNNYGTTAATWNTYDGATAEALTSISGTQYVYQLDTNTYVSLHELFGQAPACTPTGETGFYSTTATGSDTYQFTLTYTGAAQVIVAEPPDAPPTGYTTVDGKEFWYDSTINNSPSASPITIKVTPQAGEDPNMTEFWCYDTQSGWVDWGNAYSSGSGGGGSSSACALTGIQGPNQGLPDPGVKNDYQLSFSVGGETAVALSFNGAVTFSSPPSNFSASETYYSQTFTNVFTQAGSTQTLDLPVDMTNETGSGGAAYDNAELWCLAAGTWIDEGPIVSLITHPIMPHPNNNANVLVDCSNFPNLSLGINIGRDLGNTAQWTVCAARWLFQPPAGSTFNGISKWASATSPMSNIADAINATNTIVDAINTSATTNTCTAPTFDPFSQSTGLLGSLKGKLVVSAPLPADVCTGTLPSYDSTVGEVFGYRTILRDIEAIGVWTATLAALWKMMPWARPGDGIEVISAIGSSGGYTLMSDQSARDNNESWN